MHGLDVHVLCLDHGDFVVRVPNCLEGGQRRLGITPRECDSTWMLASQASQPVSSSLFYPSRFSDTELQKPEWGV